MKTTMHKLWMFICVYIQILEYKDEERTICNRLKSNFIHFFISSIFFFFSFTFSSSHLFSFDPQYFYIILQPSNNSSYIFFYINIAHSTSWENSNYLKDIIEEVVMKKKILRWVKHNFIFLEWLKIKIFVLS